MERRGQNLNVKDLVKVINLASLHTVWFQLRDFLEKSRNYGDSKKLQWLPGFSGEVGLNRWSSGEFPVSVSALCGRWYNSESECLRKRQILDDCDVSL